MKLENKKALISRALNVGKGRIILNTSRLAEIKEAITKQDVKDLLASGAIIVLGVKGRKVIVRRKTRRRMGSIKKKANSGKRGYIIITRKLRSYLLHLKKNEEISQENFLEFRKQIRAREFKSLGQMKERIKELEASK